MMWPSIKRYVQERGLDPLNAERLIILLGRANNLPDDCKELHALKDLVKFAIHAVVEGRCNYALRTAYDELQEVLDSNERE